MIAQLAPALLPEDLQRLQAQTAAVHVSEALLDYVQALVAHTRNCPDYRYGLSPRAALALVAAARAWAMLAGRDHVLPEDVQAVLAAVAPHRLQLSGQGRASAEEIAAALIEAVPLP